MATDHSDYVKGTMGVIGHKKTFGGFMGFTKYGGSAIALLVLYPTIVFGTPLGWLASLITTVVIGFLTGVALKLKGGWYVGVITGAVIMGLMSLMALIVHTSMQTGGGV